LTRIEYRTIAIFPASQAERMAQPFLTDNYSSVEERQLLTPFQDAGAGKRRTFVA
jgi:hypothetical protein